MWWQVQTARPDGAVDSSPQQFLPLRVERLGARMAWDSLPKQPGSDTTKNGQLAGLQAVGGRRGRATWPGQQTSNNPESPPPLAFDGLVFLAVPTSRGKRRRQAGLDVQTVMGIAVGELEVKILMSGEQQ